MAIPFASILCALILAVLCGSAVASPDTTTLALTPELERTDQPSPAAAVQTKLAPLPGQFIEVPNSTPRVLTLDLTRDANDIWDRIRRGFGMPDLDTPLVADQQFFYLNRPAFLKKVFERGGRYLWHIVDELERRGMPTELALLPMVESSYNPMAYSRAHASGLWQFIPSTGRSYNLTQDSWVDERRDVIASTTAALDYLQSIYDMHGDWHLALASYNWGEGAVGRAIQRNLDDGLPAEYSQLRMPEETRNYVPKLQALKNIVAQPELFHIELPYVPNSRHFVSIETPAGIDLATAARMADMPLEEFIALNPSYKRPAIAEESTLIVPVDRAERFQLRLAEHEQNGKLWRTHELERGESLASVAQTYGLSLTQLYALNGLNARSRVGAGYALLVPDGVDPDDALDAVRLIPQRPEGTGLSVTARGLDKPAKVEAKKKGRTKLATETKGAKKQVSKRAGKGGSKGNRKAATASSSKKKAAPVKAASAKPAAKKKAADRKR